VYTARQLADFLHCSLANVYNLWTSGELAYVCVGRKKGMRSTEFHLQDFLERRTQKKKEPPRRATPVKLKHLDV